MGNDSLRCPNMDSAQITGLSDRSLDILAICFQDVRYGRNAEQTPFHDSTPNASDGGEIRLGSLWLERPAVLVFLRHYG
jgi:hypothetical protein